MYPFEFRDKSSYFNEQKGDIGDFKKEKHSISSLGLESISDFVKDKYYWYYQAVWG